MPRSKSPGQRSRSNKKRREVQGEKEKMVQAGSEAPKRKVQGHLWRAQSVDGERKGRESHRLPGGPSNFRHQCQVWEEKDRCSSGRVHSGWSQGRQAQAMRKREAILLGPFLKGPPQKKGPKKVSSTRKMQSPGSSREGPGRVRRPGKNPACCSCRR